MLSLGSIELDCPAVMGILNTTPDSFSDGGCFTAPTAALLHAEQMARDGAAIIDVGGESTRPGAQAVSEQEEIDRVVPVIEALRGAVDVPISVDTSKPGVMRAAVAAGASMINDVRALRTGGALEAAVKLQQPVCLMHMQGEPRTMQKDPQYDDVVREVTQFLRDRVAQCRQAGLGEDLIVIDPGFGFGKSQKDNIELLANLRQLLDIGPPILIGVSRKSTLGAITGREVDARLPASVAAAILAVDRGAKIVRAHDVAATVDALQIAQAVIEADNSE
ncbi:MAG: dihydropteroate synthase [Gammaproteobacteria bacterium]|jgi:dihydropteroate synthase|nr:dihydropteroate synthase [Gammaproteobacteria bacterium]MDH3751549.1 dihydropteroate synthase [Gammaproteobacteria bacterium]MDH3806008.1 dihydropteroate synthase [Gammaproteobacteria bacterium]